ncbi:MAG: FeoB-associated Cys-rich membrane protein [Lentisphaeria bacterium]|nr:FeoB-associated Cys-rich membrane protein [Lentisphaeria bacterium]
MTWGNLIAGTVVALMLAGAVVAIVRQRKHGGCAGCSGCDCKFSGSDCRKQR